MSNTSDVSERSAKLFIGLATVIVMGLVVAMYLGRSIDFELSFDPSKIFPKIHATINSLVTICLLTGLYFIKNKKIEQHRLFMLTAFILSGLFLISYVFYHSISESSEFGGSGMIAGVYFFILITHIILAAISFPFILFTAYRAAKGSFAKHKKIARYTFPVWLYVAITGVLVYLFMAPYY